MGANVNELRPAVAHELDPLLGALIAKLPATGTPWPVDHQAAWLRMLAMSFGVVYGGDLAEIIDLPAFLKPRETLVGGPAGGAMADGGTVLAPTAKPAPVTGVGEPDRYYIDKTGRARMDPGGKPITVNQIPRDEALWDERPLGLRDLDTIIWADGSWPPGSLPPLNIVSG